MGKIDMCEGRHVWEKSICVKGESICERAISKYYDA